MSNVYYSLSGGSEIVDDEIVGKFETLIENNYNLENSPDIMTKELRLHILNNNGIAEEIFSTVYLYRRGRYNFTYYFITQIPNIIKILHDQNEATHVYHFDFPEDYPQRDYLLYYFSG